MSDTLDLLVGGGNGVAEKLLLIERPSADGRVRLRSWTSDDWSAVPTSSECSASGLLQEIEDASRAGRTVNRELSAVRQWLGSGPRPP
jgi:hypothetical protein